MTGHLLDLAAAAFAVLAGVGSLYSLAAVFLLRRFAAKSLAQATRYPGVSILKPLHGAEEGLHDNLKSFCCQDYPGPVQVVFGVSEAEDPAVAAVRRLQAELPAADLALVIDAKTSGANGKISNLINMAPSIRHELVVIADSDIRVEADYLRHLAGALGEPGAGLVTCLYRGIPAGGPWSRLAAMGINYHFLPSVLVGLGIGRADPCFGSTMALSRETLARIGGFEAFVNHLADDHAIGAAVRREAGRIVVPRVIVGHLCRERSAGEMLRQELRWARTLRLLDPAGFFGSAVTHPLPFALLALALSSGAPWGAGVLMLALFCRLLLQSQVDRLIGPIGAGSGSFWLEPVRDLLSFAVFVASHFTDAVTWRGQRFRVNRDGTLIPADNLAHHESGPLRI
jgi:ceramide glucosyltransferase